MWLTTIRYIQATERDTCVSRQTVHAFSRERHTHAHTQHELEIQGARLVLCYTRKCGTSLVTKAARAALRKASVSFQLSDDHDERADYHAWFQLRFFEWIRNWISLNHYYELETVKFTKLYGNKRREHCILNIIVELEFNKRIRMKFFFLILK